MTLAFDGFLVMLAFGAGGSVAARALLLTTPAPSWPVRSHAAATVTRVEALVLSAHEIDAMSTPAEAADVVSASARDVVLGGPIAFPPDTIAFIETGCYACDGPPEALYRVSRVGEGPLRVEKVFDIDRALYPSGYVPSTSSTPEGLESWPSPARTATVAEWYSRHRAPK